VLEVQVGFMGSMHTMSKVVKVMYVRFSCAIPYQSNAADFNEAQTMVDVITEFEFSSIF
jgi:hypothetical protein